MSEHFLLGLMTVLVGLIAAAVWVATWQIHREVRNSQRR
jgi:hypothetical protein